jgi:hypothetical protein
MYRDVESLFEERLAARDFERGSGVRKSVELRMGVAVAADLDTGFPDLGELRPIQHALAGCLSSARAAAHEPRRDVQRGGKRPVDECWNGVVMEVGEPVVEGDEHGTFWERRRTNREGIDQCRHGKRRDPLIDQDVEVFAELVRRYGEASDPRRGIARNGVIEKDRDDGH